MHAPDEPKVWFYAKKYGWGWGLPSCWQGWVVLLAFLALLVGGVFVFPPDRALPHYLLYTIVLTALLVGICWLKGEPPRWRWGGDAATPPKSPRALLLLHLLLGPLLFGFALYIHGTPPPEINETTGYRTATSMRGQEVWDEAQRYSANLMLAAAVVTIACQAVSIMTMKPLVSLLFSCAVLVLAMLAGLPLTERHLKRHFDEQGKSISSGALESWGKRPILVPPALATVVSALRRESRMEAHRPLGYPRGKGQGEAELLRHPFVRHLGQAPEAEALIEVRVPHQHASVRAQRTQALQSLAHQGRADALPLKHGFHGHRPHAVPAHAVVGKGHRREGDVPHHLTSALGDKGKSQGFRSPQFRDDELLRVAAVRVVGKGGFGNRGDALNIRRCLVPDGDSRHLHCSLVMGALFAEREARRPVARYHVRSSIAPWYQSISLTAAVSRPSFGI